MIFEINNSSVWAIIWDSYTSAIIGYSVCRIIYLFNVKTEEISKFRQGREEQMKIVILRHVTGYEGLSLQQNTALNEFIRFNVVSLLRCGFSVWFFNEICLIWGSHGDKY
jgi:hypothetical protein